MSNAAVIIPARWASTRFPGKPLHVLAGKPLVQHVWERASRAKNVDTVIIATDDMRRGQHADLVSAPPESVTVVEYVPGKAPHASLVNVVESRLTTPVAAFTPEPPSEPFVVAIATEVAV